MTEELAQISMQIILHAGNARLQITEALTAVNKQDFETAIELLKESRENITKAHKVQTSQVQAEAQHPENVVEYSILFTHAQDTLMTVMSEHNLAKQLVELFKTVDARLKKGGL